MNKRRRKEGDEGKNTAIAVLWDQLADATTGTITFNSLAPVAKKHDMKTSEDVLKECIAHFAENAETGMTRDEFTKLFDQLAIKLDSSGKIVT